MDLALLLPESISTPSISTDLLSIGYTLHLAMKFDLGGGDAVVKNAYVADLSLPVTVRTAQAASMEVHRRRLDLLLGYVEEDLRYYAPPPYAY
jgi:hypothetical protein